MRRTVAGSYTTVVLKREDRVVIHFLDSIPSLPKHLENALKFAREDVL